ncbi:NUDIX domain-containing protein [Flavihumibacter profundi]|jgi:predicted NUDIX family NTP pyrophosphohydrolase|uniref:NUDIX domain-containing protein n=1 Tax=Flavihumibacter profundi TaxID=2716883 RepID=UPI001CC7D2AD|nr:NUDIX domain-containing protein [Flavihumibacter profundi]MBZ5856557.1 NUDIX domain-containing protein [Flavihumibacter profundi]
MPKRSAGILFYRFLNNELEFFLVHPGGPFWANKNEHVWSIPKGELEEGENLFEAALREVKEELGIDIASVGISLTPVKQSSGKIVYAWLVLQDIDPGKIISNSIELEWPPQSGKIITIPEIDRAAWFGVAEARNKIIKGQVLLIDEAIKKIKKRS